MTDLVVHKVIGGGMVKLERVRSICPACGQQVEAVARDGQVKGYCAVAKQYVDFQIETRGVRTDEDPAVETKAKLSAKQSTAMKKRWQDPEYRAKLIAARIGKHPTAETRAKISAALTRRHNMKKGADASPNQ